MMITYLTVGLSISTIDATRSHLVRLEAVAPLEEGLLRLQVGRIVESGRALEPGRALESGRVLEPGMLVE